MITIGFIGTGNMGGALATAISNNKNIKILLANRSKDKAIKLAKSIKGEVVDNKNACKADYIFLGVKPSQIDELIEQIKDSIDDSSIIVSMINGVSLKKLKAKFGDKKIIRIMPNTPVSIGSGITFVTTNNNVNEKELDSFVNIMKKTGEVYKVEESILEIATSITGCGPAFVYMFIDAMADAGVKLGLSKKDAIKYAANTLIGSSKLVLNSNKHPDELKDEVCSPKGSTIKGVISLEDDNFRSTVINAVLKTSKKD